MYYVLIAVNIGLRVQVMPVNFVDVPIMCDYFSDVLGYYENIIT